VATHPRLRAESVALARGGTPILDGIDLDLHAASLTAVVGPSGAGKSTLLRCCNRLDDVDRGRVLLDGTDVRDLAPTGLRRRVGMVFQTPTLFPGTIRDNLTYAAPTAPDRVLRDGLDRAHLSPGLLDRPVEGLSGGEAQRVTIARALVAGPQVLLLDEPTAALDQDATAAIERLLRGLVDDHGLAVVLVTHDLAQTRRIADVAVLLVDGRVRHHGPPTDIGGVWAEAVR